MDIQRLEEEIWKQIRNGRDEVYLKIQDIQELKGEEVDLADDRRIFLNVVYVQELINKYKQRNKKKLFRDSLKVDVQPEIVKNIIEKMDTAEQNMKIRNEESWSK